MESTGELRVASCIVQPVENTADHRTDRSSSGALCVWDQEDLGMNRLLMRARANARGERMREIVLIRGTLATAL